MGKSSLLPLRAMNGRSWFTSSFRGMPQWNGPLHVTGSPLHRSGIREQTPPDLSHAFQRLDALTRDEPITGSVSAIAEATFVLATLSGRPRDGLPRSTIPKVVATCCQERSSPVSNRFSRSIQPVNSGRHGQVPRSGAPDPRRGRKKMLLRSRPVRCQGPAT